MVFWKTIQTEKYCEVSIVTGILDKWYLNHLVSFLKIYFIGYNENILFLL